MKTYKEQFQEQWLKSGGLITPATAARLLRLSRGRITQMQTEGKLKPYIMANGTPMLSFTEVMELEEERLNIFTYEFKWKIEDINKEGKLTGEMKTSDDHLNKEELAYGLLTAISEEYFISTENIEICYLHTTREN